MITSVLALSLLSVYLLGTTAAMTLATVIVLARRTPDRGLTATAAAALAVAATAAAADTAATQEPNIPASALVLAVITCVTAGAIAGVLYANPALISTSPTSRQPERTS